MNFVSRLFFAIIGVIGLAIFAYGFMSFGKLSDGQSLMLWSTVPASIMMLVGACHTKKNSNDLIAIMVMLVGLFFALLCFGMYKQSGEVAYGIFAWAGISLCATAVYYGAFVPAMGTVFSRS